MITRRAAVAGALALPAMARAQPAAAPSATKPARVLRFVPQTNLGSLDPVSATALVTRSHGFMIYDTLYGMSQGLEPSPQMAAGHQVEQDGRRVVITLRPGLKFHDGQPVLARDVVASLRRWAARNVIGQKLASLIDALTALDDNRVEYRLQKPFPLLFAALAVPTQPAFIMPERVAQTDPFKTIDDTTGSGPFRFKRDEFNSGSLIVYERNAAYEPIAAPPSYTAGGKVVHFDRVEWRVIPDAATAAAALQAGEIDWFEQPPVELAAMLAGQPGIATPLLDPLSSLAVLRLNHLHPPFDNPALRRALLPAVDQRDFMAAIVGDDPALMATDVGVFTPGSPSASAAGMEALLGPRSLDRSRALMREAGYGGAPMRLIGPTDIVGPTALTQVAADLFQRLGFNLDVALSDWGTVVQRRANHETLDKGGWSALLTVVPGLDCSTPALHPLLRGNGLQAWPGWPTSEALERLREQWFDAPDAAERHKLDAAIQTEALQDVVFVPVGGYRQMTALRRNLVDRVPGFAIFWGLRPA